MTPNQAHASTSPDPWLNHHSNRSCWDGGLTWLTLNCNPSSLAASRIRQKLRQGVRNRFRWIPPRLGRRLCTHAQTSPPKTRSGASSPGCPQNGASSHKRPLTSCSAIISSTHDSCSEITTRPTTMTLPSRHPSCSATQGNLSAVTVLNLLQKCVVHFCSQFNIVTGASAPPRHPSRPPLAPSLIALLPLLEASQAVPRPLEARRRLRLASRQRLPGLPRPLQRPGPAPTTTALVVPRGQRAFHP